MPAFARSLLAVGVAAAVLAVPAPYAAARSAAPPGAVSQAPPAVAPSLAPPWSDAGKDPAGPDVDRAAPVPSSSAPAAVPVEHRDSTLGSGWRQSRDTAVVVNGDATGLHVLVAAAASGFTWRTVATLAEPAFETDRWIGNACVTASGTKAVVVYAPRTFTNDAVLFDRGGFTAVVDLVSGAVTRLPLRSSLAYFTPACGAGEQAVVTQGGDEDLGRTRLVPVDAAAARTGAPIEVPGQLTSAVPTTQGIVAADRGGLVRVGPDGTRRVLAAADGVPFKLAVDADDGVVFLERSGTDRALVRRVAVPPSGRAAAMTLASGPLTGLDVTAGRGGRVFVLGAATKEPAAAAARVSWLEGPVGARPSFDGGLLVTSVLPTVERAGAAPGVRVPLRIDATVTATRRAVEFSVTPQAVGSTGPRTRQPGPDAGIQSGANNPVDVNERYCAVPRGDVRNQAMQPKPRQVEWAVDQAVFGQLTVQRPANWKNLGMPAYTPQGLFPPLPLAGGGRVPPQVLLAITAQESNMWQAARFAVPGVTANPLIGNYYGVDVYNGSTADDWTIRWSHADCGYGVTQVTDGMRLAGREKPGEVALPYQTQRAVALDFAANVAAGLRILQDKWNQIRNAGLVVNNGDPLKLENWFFAVWAYNSGFYPQSQAGQNDGAWGVGWANNPVNPKYPANRTPFLLTTYEDSAHPQDWPYPEKIMGWAARPIDALESPGVRVEGYRQAWWNGGDVAGPINRWNVKPPVTQFCDVTNTCVPGGSFLPNDPEVIGEPAGPCAHRNSAGLYDLKCWYHQDSTWKPDCAYTCGNELVRFDPGYAYQADGVAYPPACSLAGLPAGALIVDDTPDGTPSIRPDCPRPWTNAGAFSFTFRADSPGQYPGKIDTHQIGGGFGGHFWFTHTRTATAEGGRLHVEGKWRLNAAKTGLWRVFVALPDHGAHTAHARYLVSTAHGERSGVVSQPGTGNRWASIGVFRFNNVPEVRLTSVTPDGNGTQDIAFDAVAFAPVSAVTLRTLNWNLAGSATNNGNYEVVERLIQEVQHRNPHVITLNEVCERQYEHLLVRLTQIGYTMSGKYHPSQLNNLPCWFGWPPDTRRSAGNAVLVKATVTGSQGFVFNPSNVLQERSPLPDENLVGTDRSVACVTARFTGTPRDTKVCSTHLDEERHGDPDPIAAQREQVAELARTFGAQARTMPFVLGGDLNIQSLPHQTALEPLYGMPAGNGDFVEVDSERVCGPSGVCVPQQGGAATTAGERKLDYVFASRWHLFVPPGRVDVNGTVGVCDGHPCSDHRLVRAEVQIPTT